MRHGHDMVKKEKRVHCVALVDKIIDRDVNGDIRYQSHPLPDFSVQGFLLTCNQHLYLPKISKKKNSKTLGFLT
jgi:hypothetical protein